MLRLFALSSALLYLVTPNLFAAEIAQRTETLAERQLKTLVQREKEIWEALNKASNDDDVQTLKPKLRDVATSYDNLISDNPDFVAAYVTYGLLLSRIGERKASVSIFLEANEIDSNIPIVKNQLGNYCIEEGKYEEALAYYLKAIELDPEEPLYHHQLGTLLTEFMKFFIADGVYTREAIEKQMHDAFQKAAELSPSNFAYTYRYAESYYDLTEPQWDEALTIWEKLEEMAPTILEKQTVQLHRANVYLKQERFLGARTLINKITEPALASNKQALIDQLNKDAN